MFFFCGLFAFVWLEKVKRKISSLNFVKEFGRFLGQKSAKNRPKSPKIGKHWLKIGKNRPKLASKGRAFSFHS